MIKKINFEHVVPSNKAYKKWQNRKEKQEKCSYNVRLWYTYNSFPSLHN